MRIFLLLFSIVLVLSVKSQIGFSSYAVDSLKSNYRTMGNVRDLNLASSKFDHSFIRSSGNQFFLDRNYLSSNGSQINGFQLNNVIQQVSGLPHIGFGYVFGSQGAQDLSFSYAQVLPKNWVINTRILTSKLDGFFRNTSFSESHYGISLAKQSDKFGLLFHGGTDKMERSWSGGVIDGSLLESFAPQFIPVRKENCNSSLKSFHSSLGTYFTLWEGNSSFFKLVNETRVYGLNRLFSETDTLKGIYANTYFDTLNSSDQYQHSTLNHFSGLRWQNNKLTYTGGAKAIYWNYRNMGLYRDTAELNLEDALKFQFESFKLEHRGSYNLIGAFNQWNLSQYLYYQSGRFSYFFKNRIAKRAPQVFQRFYSSNNTRYNNSEVDLESTFSQDIGINYSSAGFRASFAYHLGINRDVYYFDSDLLNWNNTSSLSDNSIHQMRLGCAYEKGKMNIRQEYRFTSVNQNWLIIPQHYLGGSFDYRMQLFKQKKMEVTLGMNYTLSSKSNVIPVIENMGIYDLLNVDINNVRNGLFNMGAYLSIDIETFRFFLKVNNLGYLWNDLQWNYIEGVYLPELTVRVGITWDFWN